MKWPAATAQLRNRTLPTRAQSTAAVIERANALHRGGDLVAAEALYLDVLDAEPNHADALHFLGVLRQRQHRGDEARALIERSLLSSPGYVDAHNSLGNVHKLAERLELAQACYERALVLRPGFPSALLNMGIVLQARDRASEARPIYLGLLAKYPQVKEVLLSSGEYLRNHCLTMDDVETALNCFRSVLALDPRHYGARQVLATMLGKLQRPEEAAAIYRDWLEIEPDSPIARHMAAATHGCDAPLRAGDDYVRDLFDRFAENFDEQLIGRLNYVAPQRLYEALAAVLDPPGKLLAVLDAGCGTGLCGPLFRQHAQRLVGVDLSSKMLALAKTRGYDQLVLDEIGALLDRETACWDIVLSADTLVYFGDLNAVLLSAARALRPDGLIGFTLEALPGGDDRVLLSPSGRYQHSRLHVELALAAAGFSLISFSAESLRKEAGHPVPGWVVTARVQP